MTNELKDILLYELSAVTENNNILNEESTKINGEENIYGLNLECQALTSNGILGTIALDHSCALTTPNPTTYGGISMIDEECKTAPNPLNSEILGADNCVCNSECSDTNTGTTQYYYSWCAYMRITVYGYNGIPNNSYVITSAFTPQSLPSVFKPANNFSITNSGACKNIIAYATGTTTPYFTQTSTGYQEQIYSASIGGSLVGHEVSAKTVQYYVKQYKSDAQSSTYPTPTIITNTLLYPSYHTAINVYDGSDSIGGALVTINGLGGFALNTESWYTGKEGYIYIGNSGLTSGCTAIVSRDGFNPSALVPDITNKIKTITLISNNKLATYSSLYNLFSGYTPFTGTNLSNDYRLYTDGNDAYDIWDNVLRHYSGDDSQVLKLSDFCYHHSMPDFFKDDSYIPTYDNTHSGQCSFDSTISLYAHCYYSTYGEYQNEETTSLICAYIDTDGALSAEIEIPPFTLNTYISSVDDAYLYNDSCEMELYIACHFYVDDEYIDNYQIFDKHWYEYLSTIDKIDDIYVSGCVIPINMENFANTNATLRIEMRADLCVYTENIDYNSNYEITVEFVGGPGTANVMFLDYMI